MFTENFKHMHKRWNSIMNSASDPVMVAVNCPQEHVDRVHLGDKTNPGCSHSALLPRVQQLDSAVTSLHWRLTVLAGRWGRFEDYGCEGWGGGEMKPNPDFWIGPGSDDDAICWRGEPRGTDGRAQVGACPASGAWDDLSGKVLPSVVRASQPQGRGGDIVRPGQGCGLQLWAGSQPVLPFPEKGWGQPSLPVVPTHRRVPA